MKKKVTFHVDNLAYSINIDEELSKEIFLSLKEGEPLTTKQLLFALLRKNQETLEFKQGLEQISKKLPSV